MVERKERKNIGKKEGTKEGRREDRRGYEVQEEGIVKRW